MTALINIKEITGLAHIKALFESHVDRETLESYRLPVKSTDTRVLVGMSGGADSTVLGLFAAAYLAPHYPNLTFLFTDTQAEPESCYETLDAFERITGQSIEYIQADKGLFGLIDHYNGFLPSGKSRFCTRALKIKPMMDYMRSIPSEAGYINLAGIRADEANRKGIEFSYQMEVSASAAFPFVDLGITRTMVFDILDKSVGIPSTYRYRSRSGCFSCFFQRNQEAIGMLVNDPHHFAATEAKEKLTGADAGRWTDVPDTLQQMGIYAHYPVPAFIDYRKSDQTPAPAPKQAKRADEPAQVDLFGFDEANMDETGEDAYAAIALYADERLADALSPGTYWQEFITISPSLAGIKSALKHYYTFRKTTPQPHYDVDDLQVVIVQVRFAAGVLDLGAPQDSDSYTWKSNTAYRQIRHTVRNIQQVLQHEELLRRREDLQAVLGSPQVDELTWMDADEALANVESQIARAPKPDAKLLWEGLYTPSADTEKAVQMQLEGVSVNTEITQAREGLEHDEVPMACVACSM